MKSSPSLSWIAPGIRIRVQHPLAGELMLHVDGKVVFVELWQTSRGPSSPWVPTGSSFSGFWLETSRFLLNWQNRYYLLDEVIPVSDVDIQRDFAPHARKFAQSDQTAEVTFAYPPAVWRIVDIGKFKVGSVENGGSTQEGAVGRFIHCSGDGQRAMVVEDYEGAGGQDAVRLGYTIDPEAIQSAD